MIKPFFIRSFVVVLGFLLCGCTTNPATGDRQFTAFMSPEKENEVGAAEHKNIIKEFGLYDDEKLAQYISDIGARVSKNTERPDVKYKFFVVDSPIVNAFALPGGYIYISRGLLALANSESEVASVLAHETGHITGRHSAERYSRGMVTNIGALILSNAVGTAGVGEAVSLGSNLYLSAYSRGQETQADDLGVRYLSRSGYDPRAMSAFLSQLQADKELEAILSGDDPDAAGGASYFATHPATKERIVNAQNVAANYIQGGDVDQTRYLKKIDGLIYGDSVSQGILRDGFFYHPEIGFKFKVPQHAKLNNAPSSVTLVYESGALVVFDMKPNEASLKPEIFLRDVWLKDHGEVKGIEHIKINGMPAAGYHMRGSLNNKDVLVQLLAIEYSANRIARFQVVYPESLNASALDDLKRVTYSFERLDNKDRAKLKPQRIKLIQAKEGDSISSLSSLMPFKDHKQERFRVLNGMGKGEGILAGSYYKIIVE